jgi:hypothetical protein
MEDDFSPPLEAALRRNDSNTSWKPPSQNTDDEPALDGNKMFLVPLSTLMALFS